MGFSVDQQRPEIYSFATRGWSRSTTYLRARFLRFLLRRLGATDD